MYKNYQTPSLTTPSNNSNNWWYIPEKYSSLAGIGIKQWEIYNDTKFGHGRLCKNDLSGKLESGYGKINTMLSYTICMYSYINQNMASYFIFICLNSACPGGKNVLPIHTTGVTGIVNWPYLLGGTAANESESML